MANYYFGHGKVYIGSRDVNGDPGELLELAEVSSMQITLDEERIEHMSKALRIASKDLSVVHSLSASGQMVLDEHDADVLALALYGTNNTVAGGAFTATAFYDSAIADGETHVIPGSYTHLSAVTIKDSAGTPATLVAGTNYTADLEGGLVTFIDTAGFTQPFTAEGTEDAGKAVGIFTDVTPDKFVRYVGVNVAADDANVVVDLYRCDFSPSNEIQMVGDGSEINKYTLDFMMLKDSTKAENATFGQYGRYRLVT